MKSKFSTIFVGLVVVLATSFGHTQEGGGFFKKKPVEVAAPASIATGSALKPVYSSPVVPGGEVGNKASLAPIPLPSQEGNGARQAPAAPMPTPKETKQSAGSSKLFVDANLPKKSSHPKIKKTKRKASASSPVAAVSDATPITIASTALSSPRAACGSQNFIAMVFCVSNKCELPNFINHAECVKLREQNEANRSRQQLNY